MSPNKRFLEGDHLGVNRFQLGLHEQQQRAPFRALRLRRLRDHDGEADMPLVGDEIDLRLIALPADAKASRAVFLDQLLDLGLGALNRDLGGGGEGHFIAPELVKDGGDLMRLVLAPFLLGVLRLLPCAAVGHVRRHDDDGVVGVVADQHQALRLVLAQPFAQIRVFVRVRIARIAPHLDDRHLDRALRRARGDEVWHDVDDVVADVRAAAISWSSDQPASGNSTAYIRPGSPLCRAPCSQARAG